MTAMSQVRMVRSVASSQGFDMTAVTPSEGVNYSAKPVQLVLKENLSEEIRSEIVSGMDKMKFVGLDLKLVNKQVEG